MFLIEMQTLAKITFYVMYEPRQSLGETAMRKQFGDWLRNKREAKDLSQDNLALRAHVDPMTIFRLEKGLTGTKRSTLERIAEVLDLEEREVYCYAGFFPRFPSPKIARIVLKLFEMDERNQVILEEVIDAFIRNNMTKREDDA